MNKLYQKAIDGTLKNPSDKKMDDIMQITNNLPMPVNTYYPDSRTGLQYPLIPDVISPGETRTINPQNDPNVEIIDGGYAIFRCASTGGFIAVITFSSGIFEYSIGQKDLTKPNNIGSFPVPTKAIPIPPDYPRIVVGCGKLPNGGSVMREQYWKRLGDSYSIAPGEKRTINFTRISGLTQTSSSSEVMSKSLGTHVSGGWGPISASISASLNSTSTSFHEVSITEQTTIYESFEAENKATDKNDIHTYIKWQLIDVITTFDDKHVPQAATLSRQDPVLISGPSLVTSFLKGKSLL